MMGSGCNKESWPSPVLTIFSVCLHSWQDDFLWTLILEFMLKDQRIGWHATLNLSLSGKAKSGALFVLPECATNILLADTQAHSSNSIAVLILHTDNTGLGELLRCST